MSNLLLFILLAFIIGVQGNVRNAFVRQPKLIENIWSDPDFKDDYDLKNEVLYKYEESIQHENPDAKLDTVIFQK